MTLIKKGKIHIQNDFSNGKAAEAMKQENC